MSRSLSLGSETKQDGEVAIIAKAVMPKTIHELELNIMSSNMFAEFYAIRLAAIGRHNMTTEPAALKDSIVEVK